MPRSGSRFVSGLCALWTGLLLSSAAQPETLLHASFDLSREWCVEFNRRFQTQERAPVRIYQSHAGSAKQARAVMEGLPADVLTLNVALDMDVLAAGGVLVARDWRDRFPWRASPCSSTVVFLVRGSNSQAIGNWPDLVRPGRAVVVPHPKSSGNGRYAYLGAWAYALGAFTNDTEQARRFLTDLYRNVPILESGGRSATTTFVHRNIGDVLITLESEALQVVAENPGRFELVVPSRSVEVELVAAVVEPVVKRRGSRALAERYLGYLFSEPGQELLCRHFYRPRLEGVAKAQGRTFASITRVTVEELCGSWSKAHATHFAEGAMFDQIMSSLR